MIHRSPLWCLILTLAFANVVSAATLEDLIATGELEAGIVLKSSAPHYQKAPIEFAVKVGTPKGFKNGTRMRDFTIPSALVRSTSKFAFNETQVIDGITWRFQSWSFELFSERTGMLSTPALTTYISVETEAHGVVEGELSLQIPDLEIEVPPGTEGLTTWVAANEFEVEETWEGELESHEVGDAITRIRSFSIKGAPAMAIPASPPVELDGVQVYDAPTLVDDKAVGGSLQGIRKERVVFTVKSGGTFTIPAHRIDWFNLKTQTVEQIDFPAHSFEVDGLLAATSAADSESESDTAFPWKWALVVLGAALIYFLIRYLGRSTGYHFATHQIEAWRNQRRDKTAYMQAVAQQDSRQCLALLYKRMAGHSEYQLGAACAHDLQLSATADALMAHAYGSGAAPEAADLKQLWDECSPRKNRKIQTEKLQLNPGPRE